MVEEAANKSSGKYFILQRIRSWLRVVDAAVGRRKEGKIEIYYIILNCIRRDRNSKRLDAELDELHFLHTKYDLVAVHFHNINM